MFKLPLSRKAIQAAVGLDRDYDSADARAIGLDVAVWVFASDIKRYQASNDKLIHCSCTYARAEHINAALGYVVRV